MKKKRMIIMLAIVGVILGGVFGFQAFKGVMIKQYMASMGNQPQTVATMVVASEVWNTNIEAVGTMRAAKGVDLSTEVAGIVDALYFDSGDEVKSGKLLAKLRADNDEARLRSLEAAAKLAATNYNRNLKQLKAQAVAQATVDADAALYAGAKAQVAEQKALVERKNIRAPFSGSLGIRKVDIGQYVNPGTPVVTLQALNPIYLDFYLPQNALARIKKDQTVMVKNTTYPDKEFSGKVEAVNSKVDEATRNVEVRVSLENKEHLLLPGMYSTVSIDVGEPESYLTLPQTAITYNPYGDTVFIVTEKSEEGSDEKKQVVEQRFVTLGPTRGDQVAILTGISEGDKVVISGQLKLQNGAAIIENNEVVPDNKASPEPSDT